MILTCQGFWNLIKLNLTVNIILNIVKSTYIAIQNKYFKHNNNNNNNNNNINKQLRDAREWRLKSLWWVQPDLLTRCVWRKKPTNFVLFSLKSPWKLMRTWYLKKKNCWLVRKVFWCVLQNMFCMETFKNKTFF